MAPLAAGAVVLVYFPFSDLSQSKLRPAVVLAGVGRDDWIMCQITSRPYADPNAVELTDADYSAGTLQRVSYARYTKLFTANVNLIAANVGPLSPEKHQEIVGKLVDLLRAQLS